MNSPYHYDRFKAEFYDLEHFEGPKAGEIFPDFSLLDSNAQHHHFADFKEQWICLETGSMTCPQYISNIGKMMEYAKKYPDIHFLVLYVREAHPGNYIQSPKSDLEKIALANRMKNEYGEQRLILVDHLDGQLHKQIGLRPNSIYLINSEGKVVFRSDWNVPPKLEEVLKNKNQANYYQEDHFEPVMANPFLAIKVILKAGWIALWDFIKALPKLLRMHFKSKKLKKFK